MKYAVRDEGDPRKYFIMIPNMIDDSSLSAIAFRLYVHLKRVAGEEGKCWQSVRTMAEACNMSPMSVSRARKELEQDGYIRCNSVPSQRGKTTYEIEVVDVWVENGLKYASTRSKPISTSSDTNSTSQVLISTSSSIKEEPIKKNQLRKTQEEEETSITSSVSSFGDNMARDSLKLYTMVTGQIQPINSHVDRVIADLSTVLDHYKSIDAAVNDGQRVFARWCSTQGKSGKTYSRVNVGWLGWWLDEIAPSPEKKELSIEERIFGVKR